MTELPLTLLQLQGAPLHPSALDQASLVLIDLQEEYRTGALPLPGIGQAVAEAARLLDLARTSGMPIVHIQHQVAPGAPIFAPEGPAFALMPEVAAREGERVVVKTRPNAFAETDLDAILRAGGRPEIIIAGAMTHMCVSATARAAFDLGYRTTLVAAACATRDLPSIEGRTICATDVHRTALAELADVFAIVIGDTAALMDG